LNILTVIGTRPEAVKLAPVVTALMNKSDVNTRILVTAQHREMLDEVLLMFDISPDYDLDIMSDDQTPTDVFTQVLNGIQPILVDTKPDWLLVQGDTTTVLAATIAAAYRKIPVGHVEAGLRTHNRDNPFPEEINRVLTDHAASLHFAPTLTAREALLREGISDHTIHVTGNTVIDTLTTIISRPTPSSLQIILDSIPADKHLILVTAHRRENFGEPLQRIVVALLELAKREDIHIVYPVHPNPNINKPINEALLNQNNISVIAPLDYLTFAHLMKQSYLILTDSGGIQEEAPGLGVPVLVMREVTERTEAIEQGTALMVGTDSNKIIESTTLLLENKESYGEMIKTTSPFGDGKAAQRIVNILLEQI
jgi:UDP-N-acetylglucosamine 2-epimerase (non-hydrolysing)